nr:hypothetical protein Iba_chr11aCG13810 [Ipomoea batatas]
MENQTISSCDAPPDVDVGLNIPELGYQFKGVGVMPPRRRAEYPRTGLSIRGGEGDAPPDIGLNIPELGYEGDATQTWQCSHSWVSTSNHTYTTYRDEFDRCQSENVGECWVAGTIVDVESGGLVSWREEVVRYKFNLNDEVPIEPYDDPPNAPLPSEDDFDRENEMGDISQQDVMQQVMSRSPFITPYVNQLHVYEEGSSSQIPPHAGRPIRTPSNHMTNDPFPHPIQNYITEEDTTINTSQVVNPTQPQGARGDIIYQRRRPVRNRRRPPCGIE